MLGTGRAAEESVLPGTRYDPLSRKAARAAKIRSSSATKSYPPSRRAAVQISSAVPQLRNSARARPCSRLHQRIASPRGSKVQSPLTLAQRASNMPAKAFRLGEGPACVALLVSMVLQG